MRAAGIDIGTTTISGVVLDTEAKKADPGCGFDPYKGMCASGRTAGGIS